MMRLSDYNGNPYIGVYCAVNESVAFVPVDSSQSLLDGISEALQVEAEVCTISGTNVIGALLAMNSNGAVVTSLISGEELARISRRLPVYPIDDKLNACGNNILVNDRGAVVNPDIGRAALREIERVLQVDVVQGTVAGHRTAGSACVATNKGVLCHPSASADELAMIESVLKVPTRIGTLNYGTPLVGACMVANSKGAAIGFRSTPIELGRVEDTLGLI